MNAPMIKSIFRLTNRLFIPETEYITHNIYNNPLDTLSYGYILHEDIYKYYSVLVLKAINIEIQKELTNYEDWTKTFHESWKAISEMSEFEMVVKQIIHYLTTYGTNFTSPFVYIPNDKKQEFSIPEYFDAPILVVKPINKTEVEEYITSLISSGMALKQETIEDIFVIIDNLHLDPKKYIQKSKNKEFTIYACDHYYTVPKKPEELLRLLIYQATDKLLLIKNAETIESIKESANDKMFLLFLNQYIEDYGIQPLAQIFYRFKPLFLALKANKDLAPLVNKIRRKAKKYHTPMKVNFMNDVTRKIKQNEWVSVQEFEYNIEHAPIAQVIRLYNALKLMVCEDKLYKVRNGKVWVERKEVIKDNYLQRIKFLYMLYNRINTVLQKNLQNARIYLPSYVDYAVPASGKDFVGNIPIGSQISTRQNLLLGIHWKNTDRNIDLDLSCMDSEYQKIGWNARHKSASVYFSGDITMAPDGATEFLKFNTKEDSTYIINVNFYNYDNDEAPFSILVGADHQLNTEDVFRPEQKIAEFSTTMSKKERLIGLVQIKDGESTFIFYDGAIYNKTTSSGTELVPIQIRNLQFQIDNKLMLRQFPLNFCDKKENATIDLSPENLNKNTILQLLEE